MTTTICVDCNRSISKYSDDNRLRWVNTLDGGLQLKKGDVVTMASCQINQRGANVDTISISEDITETLNFVYYIIDSDTFFAGTDKDKVTLYRDADGTGARPTKMKTNLIGYTHTPYFYHGYNHTNVELQLGQQVIFIPAGSYSPNNLATLISDQFAGRQTSNKDPFDYLTDDGLRKNTEYPGLCSTDSECMIYIPTDSETLSDADGDSNMFLQMGVTKEIVDDQLLDGGIVTKTEMLAKGQHWISTQASDKTNVEQLNEFQFLGAVPSIVWNADKSRFGLENLHQPYRIPNMPDPTKTTTSDSRGEQATIFYRNAIPFGVYPFSSIGGIAVTNPAWKYVSENTTIGKDIVDKIANGSDAEKLQARVKRTTYKFNQYFANDNDALEGWKNTIWSRMGFEMTQFTDDSKWNDYYPLADIKEEDGVYTTTASEKTKMIGITTTQEITTDMATSSGGFGSVNHGAVNGFFNQAYNYETPGFTNNTSSNSGGSVTPPQSYQMLSESLPLLARRLPRLADSPYYNVWTDLIDSSNWYSNKGNRNTLIGQCNKNYSASDFLYQYDNGINFTITKDRCITEITTAILLPNDKSPNPALFDDECSVLYKIVRPDESLELTKK